MCVAAMQPALYCIYLATFQTKKWKTNREYIGCTLNKADRERALRSNQYGQPWLSAGVEGLQASTLLANVPGKQSALAIEAKYAADRMMQSRIKLKICRGGPWCLIELTDEDLCEIKAVHKCTSLPEILALADKWPDGHLAYHLRDLQYKPLSSAMKKTIPVKPPRAAMKTMKLSTVTSPGMTQSRAAPVKMSVQMLRNSRSVVRRISKAGRSGTRESGAARRSRLGLTGTQFMKDKYGNDVNVNRAKATRKWRHKQPVSKKPAAGASSIKS